MNKTTRYSIINISIERLNKLFEKEKDVFYDTIFSSADTHEVLQKLDELKADDDTYSIEIYTTIRRGGGALGRGGVGFLLLLQ